MSECTEVRGGSDYTSHWCPLCGGSSHPATGCVYTPTFIVCKRCTLDWGKHIERWTNMKGRRKGLNFYDHVNVVRK